MLTVGVCSKESGMERSRTFMSDPSLQSHYSPPASRRDDNQQYKDIDVSVNDVEGQGTKVLMISFEDV
jgi:hypothetical protein